MRIPSTLLRSQIARATLSAACLVCVGGLPACSSPRTVKQVPVVTQDVPEVLRGTIGAECSIRGTEAQLISGLGIVVGLNGTGGGELPPSVQATMEREAARGGIGKGNPAAQGQFEGVTPQEFLRSPNVAVVIVEAQVSPGAPEGTPFDVYIRTLPGSSVSSLEGGTLWTTDLRLGPASVFGGPKTHKIAEARGPVFINPFTEPDVRGGTGEVIVTRTTGRVLGGGKVTDPLQLELVLDNESHSRARTMASSINGRFPRNAGDEGSTAHGRSSNSIAVRIPREYRDKPSEFLQLVRCLRVNPAYPQEAARQYAEALKTQPALAEELSWCLQAVGKASVPFLIPLYEYPEFVPRMAAIQAGARLGDLRTVPHLINLLKTAPPAIRVRAAKLMGDMPLAPTIDIALRDSLDAEELEVRIAAYESLRKRGDPLITRTTIGTDPLRPTFILEVVPAHENMVYVTQQGEPRIVLLGGLGESPAIPRSSAGRTPSGILLERPMLVSAWSGRLMLTCDNPTDEVRLYYRDARSGAVTKAAAPLDVVELVRFFSRRSSGRDLEPGLGLSFSEVVGALYEITRQGGIAATFATEEDRLKAEIFAASQATLLADRPESDAANDPGESLVFRPQAPSNPLPARDKSQPSEWRPAKIVPLTPAAKPKPAATGE